MIPPFDDNGYLPPGVHPATPDEFAERFGGGAEIRGAQVESVAWLLDLARRAGVERLVVGGSFVTDKPEPNDVDCALLIGPDFPRDASAEAELLDGLPFLQIALVKRADFNLLVDTIYATDRAGVPRGLVEVML